MSEEISRQIEDAAAARSREAASRTNSAQLADLIVAGATRRRRARGFALATFAVVGVLAIAGGTVAAMGAWGPDTVAPATQSATPTAIKSTAPSTSTSPSPSATPVADGGLDGIADYPALAPARGEGFPSAYVMEDWVWDHVGKGWSLESYSMRRDPYVEPTPEVPDAAIYLLSPDGAAFELVSLDHAQSNGLRVVSWREGERKAVVWWESDGVIDGDAAELDLETGVLDPLDFTMPGKVHSTWEDPIAVSADGTELWWARALDGTLRYYRWSQANGWTTAAVNDLPGLGTNVGFNLAGDFPGVSPYTRQDGGAVALERTDAVGDGWGGSVLEYAVYDVERDVVTLTQATFDTEALGLEGWSGSDTLEYIVYDGEGKRVSTEKMTLNGAPALGPVPAEFMDGTLGKAGESAVVGFGEATANGVFYRECSC